MVLSWHLQRIDIILGHDLTLVVIMYMQNIFYYKSIMAFTEKMQLF